MNIYIVGFKNSGKTTTGKRLARKLGMEFLDLDNLMEEVDGRSVPEIFSQDGEEGFREKEREALHRTGKMDNKVISTGGGAPRFYDNMDYMLKNGATIYLKLDEDTLFGRLKVAAKTRPILKGKSPEQIREYVRDLIQNHEHHYMRAKYVVDSKGLSPNDLVDKILSEYSE